MQGFGHEELGNALRGELGDGGAVLVDLVGHQEAVEARGRLQRFEHLVDVLVRQWGFPSHLSLLVFLLLCAAKQEQTLGDAFKTGIKDIFQAKLTNGQPDSQ